MRRLVVQPRLFGTVNGYEWDVDSNPKPHNDYCQLWDEYSIRVWEPTRMKLSTPGVVGDPSAFYESIALPTKAHIRGIKGDAHIRFDGTEAGVGTWLWADGPGEGTLLNPQPSAAQTYNALGGVPWAKYLVDQTFTTSRDWNPGFYIPVFCAMYRGTYKSIDNSPGWEIDTGPGDDPDVLLPLDITSPDVLESGRLDWWTLDQVRAPHSRWDITRSLDWNGAGDNATIALETWPAGGSHFRFSMNLDANKRVASDQILWLHWKTGVIKLPVVYPGTAGGAGPELVCANYVNHKFTISVHATMLADTAVSVA